MPKLFIYSVSMTRMEIAISITEWLLNQEEPLKPSEDISQEELADIIYDQIGPHYICQEWIEILNTPMQFAYEVGSDDDTLDDVALKFILEHKITYPIDGTHSKDSGPPDLID